MTRERRSRPRETPGELGFIQINRDEGGRILNISETGLCFESFTSIERENPLRFWFSLDLRERIYAGGKLAWLDRDRRIGGLRFFDLSAKAQRHLREHLKNTGKEQAQPNRRVLFVALAEPSAEEVAATPQVIDGAALQESMRGTRYSRRPGSEAVLGRYADARQADAAAVSAIGMVPLERYRTTRRRQFFRGVLLGAAASLAIGAVAQKYFGGKQRTFSSGAPGTVPVRATPGAPETPASTGALEGEGRPKSAAAGVLVPAAAVSAVPRAAQAAGAEAHESEKKAGKKPSASPQKLWAAVQQGSMKAAVELAERYVQGNGVPLNCDQARILLLVASEKNNADAIRRLRELDKTGCPIAPPVSVPKTPSPTTEPNKP
ncbi:MAG TPA: PilZ domain-containing protein [Candidatus Acidoferrum sp.]|nr:PilZ domain-containing protein [Candidatus Acidoferrum sp.]